MREEMTALLAKSVERAMDSGLVGIEWHSVLENLDVRIRHLSEELDAKPVVPPELQDEYRREIDALSLENMALSRKLAKAAAAAERAKHAYREETQHNALLVQKLDVLEERLADVLRKRVVG